MGIAEELMSEAATNAGSPEGFLRLIKLVLQEVDRLDVTGPDAPRQYVALLRAYVLIKRQLGIFNKRCEYTEIDKIVYTETVHRLKRTIKAKRDEARKYAAQSIPPEKLKELNRYVGTNSRVYGSDISAGVSGIFNNIRELTHRPYMSGPTPVSASQAYLDKVYPRSYTRTN